MRLPPVSRPFSVVLNQGRWASAPLWRAHLPQRTELRFSHDIAVAQHSSPDHRGQSCDRDLSSPAPRDRAPHSDLLSAALDLYRDPEQFVADAKDEEFNLFTSARHFKLRNITAAFLLRQVPDLTSKLRSGWSDDRKWAEALVHLKRKGYTLRDVKHWVWILTPNDPDKRVTRFLRKSQHHPPFILLYLLSQKPAITTPDSLWALLHYCRRWYSSEQRVSEKEPGRSLPDEIGQSTLEHFPFEQARLEKTAHHVPKEMEDAVKRPSLIEMGMDPLLFGKLLDSLAQQAIRLSCSALPAIASLAVSHIKEIAEIRTRDDAAYKCQCQLFNAALQAVSRPAIRRSYERSVHSWRAITTLLAYSSSLEKPLIIERESYRAIRQTLLLLPKTDAERETASALTTSWPPYRVLRDGMEERVGTEEYVSRVVKAGYMMLEAGYAKGEIDVTTDILGGMAPDQSPTVQTRANYPRNLRVANPQWAALIRTTRNAQEAWMAFQRPPEPGMKPTFSVYWELLNKIASKPANPEHHNLPGDGREVFPYDDTNLTEFEKGRLTPPSPRDLIAEMFQSGIVLHGHRLPMLISMAYSMREALEYLDHSDMGYVTKEGIKLCMTEFQEPPLWLARRHFQNILRAFVKLLCDLQPNRTVEMAQNMPKKHFVRIFYAFRLVQRVWLPTKHRNEAPWEVILDALARPKIALGRGSLQHNELLVLSMALDVLEVAEGPTALNTDMVNSLGRTVWKVMASMLSFLLAPHTSTFDKKDFMRMFASQSNALRILERPSSNEDDRSWRQILTPIFEGQNLEYNRMGPGESSAAFVQEAARRLKKAWRVVSTIGPASRSIPNLEITPTNINNYMRTLAYLGDYEEMVLLLQWTIREWLPAGGSLTLLEGDRMVRVFLLFRAFAEPMLSEDVVRPLREEITELSRREISSAIFWPTDEEVEDYIRSDKWGNHQNLRELLGIVKEMEMAADEEASDQEQGTTPAKYLNNYPHGLGFGARRVLIRWRSNDGERIG